MPPAPLTGGPRLSVVVPDRGGILYRTGLLDRLAAEFAALDAEILVVDGGAAPPRPPELATPVTVVRPPAVSGAAAWVAP